MLYNKKVIIVFLFIVSLFLTFSVSSMYTEPAYTTPVQFTTKVSFVNSSVVSNSITITGNTALATISTSGNGTVTNPYMIENFIITCGDVLNFSTIGVGIHNTDKYFILRNIQISGCGIGIAFSNVTFGSIMYSYVYNNYAFGILLNSSSNNNILVNNTETNSLIGFGLISSHNNTLINNTAENNFSMGFGLGGFLDVNYFGLAGANHTVLTGNTAINNNIYGFALAGSSNNLLKNNIANHNGLGDYFDHNPSNNTLINNDFIIINNGLDNSLTQPLLSTKNIIAVSILIVVYSILGYIQYSNFQKKDRNNDEKKLAVEQPRGNQGGKSIPPVVFGVVGPVLVIFCILFFPAMIINFTYPINLDIVQMSPLSGLLLLLGEGMTIVGVFIFRRVKSLNRYMIAEYFLLIGIITQVIGIILAFDAYSNISNGINALINSSGGSTSTIQVVPLSGLLFLIGGAVFIIAGFIIFIKFSEFIYTSKIAAYLPMLSIFVIIIGIVLAVAGYNDIMNEFNALIQNEATSSYRLSYPYFYKFLYIISPNYGLFICLFGIILAILAYYYQRKESQAYVVIVNPKITV